MTIDRDRLKQIVEQELKKMRAEVNAAHDEKGRFAKKGKGKTYSLTKNAEDDVADDTELEVPARGRITSQGKISSRYGMNTGDPDKNCGRLTIDGNKKTKTRSCKDYPKKYSELEEVVPALATAARVASKAGAVADKVGKVAGAVKTGADVVKKIAGDDDDEDVKTEKKSTAGRERQKKETEKRNRMKNKNDLVPRAVDSPSVRRAKLFGDDELMSLARGIAEEMEDEDNTAFPRWDKNGKLIQPDELEGSPQTLKPHDEIYIKELIKQNVAAALKQTRAQAQKQGVGCSWKNLMAAIQDIETAQKGHKEPK